MTFYLYFRLDHSLFTSNMTIINLKNDVILVMVIINVYFFKN